MTNDEVYGPVTAVDDPFTAIRSQAFAADADDAYFMLEEEAAEVAFRAKPRYARSPRRAEPRRASR